MVGDGLASIYFQCPVRHMVLIPFFIVLSIVLTCVRCLCSLVIGFAIVLTRVSLVWYCFGLAVHCFVYGFGLTFHGGVYWFSLLSLVCLSFHWVCYCFAMVLACFSFICRCNIIDKRRKNTKEIS